MTSRVLPPLILLLVGCASAPKRPVDLDHAPPDFALGVTVFSPAGEASEIDAQPRPLRPARYIVEPDRVLRAAIGPGSSPAVYPRQTRRLDAHQADRLWLLVVESGMLESDAASRIDSVDTFLPARTRTVASISITCAGSTHHHAVRLPSGDEESQGVLTLVDQLADLAWIPE